MDVTLDLKCRLCFKGDAEELINIFDVHGRQLNISSILAQHLWFEIKEDDLISIHICDKCWFSITSFHDYYIEILQIQNSGLWNLNDEKISIPIKEEFENNELTEQPVLAIEYGETISENVGLTDNDDVKEENPVYNIEFSNDDATSVFDDNICYKSDDKSEDDDEKEKTSKRRPARNVKVEEDVLSEDKQIRDFFKMGCDLCSMTFEKFQHVKSHYRIAHKVRGYLSCCERKFFKRCRALEHAQRHINPDAFRCTICNKNYSNKSGLLTHLDSHEPTQEKPFKCLKCPKTFAKKFQCDQHQIRHIPNEEKRFTCEECGKAFAKNSILQYHIRGVHRGAYVHICEICAKSFKSKKFYEQHCQIEHSEVAVPKVQCQKCGVWLKHEHSLRSHMRLHEESESTHFCNICGKQAPNKSALRDHQRYVHLDERTHKCGLCDKAFKRAIALKEHMTTHTGEVLYTCPHCPKTFNSRANMHSHRKKIHPKEWEENRRNGRLKPPT